MNLSLANRFEFNDKLRPTGGTRYFDKSLSSYAFEDSNNPQTQIRNTKEAILEQYLKDRASYDDNVKNSLKAFEQAKNNRVIGAAISAAVGIGGAGLSYGLKSGTTSSVGSTTYQRYPSVVPETYSPHMLGGIINRYAVGGSVKSNQYMFGGQDPKDTIPAMLQKGEWVIREPVVRKLGKSFFDNLNNLNSNRVSYFSEGGGVGNIGFGTSNSSDDITNHLLEQINLLKSISNSLINKNSPQGTGSTQGATNYYISISTNIDSGGKTTQTSTSSSSNKQDDQTSNQDNEQKSKKFTELMRNIALDTIITQRKPGGLLSN